MDLARDRQIEDINECWPINPAGPLPSLLANREYIGEAFFKTFPQSRMIPCPAVRRALKHAAKRLGIASGKLTSSDDQVARDEALAFKFASLPLGREALPNVEALVHNGRKRQLTSKFEWGLPQILWSWFRASENHVRLVEWTEQIWGKRPDLGKAEAYYITAELLEDAFSNGEPPLALNDPDFARTILIFAGLLPTNEAVTLIQTAGKLGINGVEAAATVTDKALENQGIINVKPPIMEVPTYEADLVYEESRSPLPLESGPALLIAEQIELARNTASQKLNHDADLLSKRISELVSMIETDFNVAILTISEARNTRQHLTAMKEEAKAFIHSRLEKAFDNLKINLAVEKLIQRQEKRDVTKSIRIADAIFQFSSYAIESDVKEFWHPNLHEGCSLDEILDEFNKIPHIRQFIDNREERTSKFVGDAKKFITTEYGKSNTSEWLLRLSMDELEILSNAIDTSEWPVLKAILARLGLEAGPQFAKTLDKITHENRDERVWRDLLHFVDPAAVIFDNFPILQRIITAERLLDIFTFGPLQTIFDPSLRLSSQELVGTSLIDLINLLSSHIDLFETRSELHALAISKSSAEKSQRQFGLELLSFATTPSNSSGFYLLLRETVREKFFLPLVRNGRIDTAAANELARSFVVDDAIDQADSVVRKMSNRTLRIEARHRARVHAYVRSGKEFLDAFVRSGEPAKSERRSAFAVQLQQLLDQLNVTSAPLGSKEWLGRRVAEIILGKCQVPDLPTLKGEAGKIAQYIWTDDDTAWAQQSLDLPEFYLLDNFSPLDVALAALYQWSLGKRLTPSAILDSLVKRKSYSEALSYIHEVNFTSEERLSLSSTIKDQAKLAMEPTAKRLVDLKIQYEGQLFDSITTNNGISDSISQYNVRLAEEQLVLLEMELEEASERRRLDTIDASKATEKSLLLAKLLQVGVEGPNEKWTFVDLQKKWTETLSSYAVQRTHLKVVEKVFDSGLPELSKDAEQFSALALEPRCWLPEVRAHDLSEFLDGAAEKLRTWGQLAGNGNLNGTQREALIKVIRWFVRFVEEQTAELKCLDASQPVDNLLERVLEASDAVEQALDPLACANSLGFIGEIIHEHDVKQPESMQQPAPTIAGILSMIEHGKWGELTAAAQLMRAEIGNDDSRRVTDVGEFAETFIAITNGNYKAFREGIPAAARTLVAHGSLLNRALPVSQQLQIAYELLAASILASDEQVTEIPHKQPLDRSWTALAGRKAQYRHIFTGNTLPSRTLEQLCFGTLGRDIVNRLWDAPTATPEPGPFRAALLTFLYERGLTDNLLSLAQRHDPGIKSRLEQLVNLRSISSQRPDLIPVSEAVAEQIVKASQGVPFRMFVSSLPTAAKSIDADLIVSVDNDIIFRINKQKDAQISVAISIEPRGLVPELIEAVLFPEDDVSFGDGSRRAKILSSPLYFANQFTVPVKLGLSWIGEAVRLTSSFRVRVNAKILAGELISRDVVCELNRSNSIGETQVRIDDETLLDTFPGVENTPALGESFIGRHDELEKLHRALIGARRPSPVLLTGMRRIGKTSLLYAFHERYRHPDRNKPTTVYFSLAERRAAMMASDVSVSSVFFSAIAQALGKRHFSSTDKNRELGERLKQKFGNERDAIRKAIFELWDSESVADSLTNLSESLLKWTGGGPRIIYLIDEAETLVLPYKGTEAKRLELEQLLQGLREVSQTSTKVGLLLCGSNHIDEFTHSYKEAFFGSSVGISLNGITATETARKLISPDKLARYITFTGDSVRYAIELCAGMPQFLWQLGAATSAIVRSGPVGKADVRQGVSLLVGERTLDLPFKAYEILEPIEHMLGLQGQREQDLSWLLLYRVANSSSLVVDEAQQNFIIDQSLLELDEFEGWKQRLISLVNLSILEMTRPAMYRFRVPIFAEGFRALRQQQKYLVRHQRAAK